MLEDGAACHLVVDFIAHFCNPLRLRILCALSMGETSVNDLTEMAGARQPAVSQQLNLLRRSGLVERRREGNRNLYRIADPLVLEMMESIFNVAEELVARQAPRERVC
jgi:ArsR family transcriptional regulator